MLIYYIMSYSNYANMAEQLASATRDDRTPFLDDIVNYKMEFGKGSLQAFGGAAVNAKAIEGIKLLRSKIRGVAKSKYGFDDADLDDIQGSLENGDMSEAIAKLSGKLTNKLTDAGRNALQGIKDRLQGVKNLQEEAEQGLADARARAVIQPRTTTQTVDKPAAARDQIDDTGDMEQAESGEDLIAPLNRQIARFNNLDGRAQNRVAQATKDDIQQRTDPDEDVADLPEGHPDIDVIKNNFQVRENAIRAEEQNPETTFKDPNFKVNPADDDKYTNAINKDEPANRMRNPDEFDNPAETEDIVTQAGDVSEGAADALASAATKAASVASKVSEAGEAAEGTLAGLTEASTSLDWSPVGWLATAGLGIASLITGLELKAHHKKFETPPHIVKSYAEQADV